MSPFQRFINNLSDDDLPRLSKGEAAVWCDDNTYRLARHGIVQENMPTNPDTVRSYLLAHEREILERLYQTQPLCREEFDYQAEALLQEHGADKFYRHADNSWAMMIDGSLLTAVPPEDVRSQYGYYCEGDEPLPTADASETVKQWLKTGIAYEDYRVKTHCRYICR